MLEGIAGEAGLTPEKAFDTSYAFEYADREALGRGMLAPGMMVAAIRSAGEEAVRTAIVEALERYRTPSGSYRLDNEWHYLLTRKSA